MIKITFFKENGKYVGVSAAGHSGLAEQGADILCAAASALIQTAYLAAADILGDIGYTRDDDKGEFAFTVGADCKNRHDINVIFRALWLGLSDLQSGYPQNINMEER